MSELEDKLNSILSSPGQMSKIMELAKSFSGEGKKPESAKEAKATIPDAAAIIDGASKLGDIDPKMFRIISRLIGEYTGGDNEKSALVRAMKPFVQDDKKKQLDKALEMTKLAHAARLAFGELKGGENDI